MEKHEFFMRFYATKELVLNTIEQMKRNYLFGCTIERSKLSCNYFIPNEVWQVNFTFDTEEERDRFRKDPEIYDLYMSVQPKNATFVERKPKDMAYQIGGGR